MAGLLLRLASHHFNPLSGKIVPPKLPIVRCATGHLIGEIYCGLDLQGQGQKPLDGRGFPLPRRVAIQKKSRKILDYRYMAGVLAPFA
jgi:hypothetical protein